MTFYVNINKKKNNKTTARKKDIQNPIFQIKRNINSHKK
jgi:hypothetical protein